MLMVTKSLSIESYAAMRSALAPGKDLDQMNRVMIQNIAASLDKLASFSGKTTKISTRQLTLKHRDACDDKRSLLTVHSVQKSGR
jgi:hypothetical protein